MARSRCRIYDLYHYGVHHFCESTNDGCGRYGSRRKFCRHLSCRCVSVPCYGRLRELACGSCAGHGSKRFFYLHIVVEMGYTWNVALGAVFIAGVLFVVMSVTKLRAWILESIPMSLRIGMGAGVGLFIGVIGLQSGGIIADHPSTLLTLGKLTTVDTLLSALGFYLLLGFQSRGCPERYYLGY